MFKIIRSISLVLLAIGLTSCFQILEDVTVNADGSGVFKYEINFSESASTINSLLEKDEVEGYSVPSKEIMQQKFDQLLIDSKKVNGISDVRGICNLDDYIFTYSCQFTKVNDLNKSIDTLKAKSKQIDKSPFTYYELSADKKRFKRSGDNLVKDKYNELTTAQKAIFIGASYTCIFRFESEIDSLLTRNVQLSKNNKVTYRKITMSQVTQNAKALNQEILLK